MPVTEETTGASAVNLATDLEGAAARGEIRAQFQPQIDVHTGRIVAVEALARWQHPEFGLVSPDVFIPLAEAHDLIGEIGDFMIDEGSRCAAEWNSADQRIDVAVNVSPRQLVTLDFLDHLEANLYAHGLAPESLIIEITESLPVSDVPEVSTRLLELSERGLGVSVDDFGTGHTSIEQLRVLPLTEVKIDQSLVRGIDNSRELIEEVILVAHERHMRVVAEGVETEEHFSFVRELGCDRAQGYYFGRPMEEWDITRLIEARV
jgi:EAL domain-containing protein (putative c-di-GMP-specific phosphodiesterase class I)